jgi:hypothetical protein
MIEYGPIKGTVSIGCTACTLGMFTGILHVPKYGTVHVIQLYRTLQVVMKHLTVQVTVWTRWYERCNGARVKFKYLIKDNRGRRGKGKERKEDSYIQYGQKIECDSHCQGHLLMVL